MYYSYPYIFYYSKFQIAKTTVKASFIQVYNTYIPYDSQLCMDKYKAIQTMR